jgi:hypothetical protein
LRVEPVAIDLVRYGQLGGGREEAAGFEIF